MKADVLIVKYVDMLLVDEEKKMNNPWKDIFICLLTILVLISLNITVDNRHEIKCLKNEVLMNRAEINQLIDEVRSSIEFDERM